MPFLTEPEPPRGIALPVLPGISRITAANPTPMTYHGTNTYLIESEDGLTVLDPGPEDDAHVQAILTAAGGRIVRIVLTHTHRDHVGAAPALRAATGVGIHGFHDAPDFTSDHPLHDGDIVAGWTAVHTPGHAPDHLCFSQGDILMSGDHVMGWSTTVVGPPRGDMCAYFASLHRLLGLDHRLYLPGHGPPLEHPRPYVQDLLRHREQRETAIAAALPNDVAGLVDTLYAATEPRLRPAAARNVLAHLLKLQAEGRARLDGEMWRAA